MAVVTSYLHQVETSDGVKTIFETPSEIPVTTTGNHFKSYFNIVMVDVSGSMNADWDTIESTWNSIVSNCLQGTTKIFVFGAKVQFIRYGTKLCREDFLCSSTNLTAAIEKIRHEIRDCASPFIRVFLITDGMHNASRIQPSVEIGKLVIPSGKSIEVFLLGLRESFPVEYSITIRSLLHNGNANVPSLFWAKNNDEIESEMHSMADIILKGSLNINLSEAGYLCPEFTETSKVHLGEFVFFHCSPDDIENKLKLSHTDENDSEIEIPCTFIKRDVNARVLLDKVFRQWNSIIIQQHRKKKPIPEKVFDLMKDIYQRMHVKMENSLRSDINSSGGATIKNRLLNKDIKRFQNEFATLMNQSKTIVGIEGEFISEMELAENILKTTVKSKYDLKNLKMKGHKIEDYDEDMKEFLKIYDTIKNDIMDLPDPTAEECCNITYQSPILDLKDDDFLELVKEDKFTFMKTFTVTGIPIFAPIRDSSQINPWALCIKSILVAPYTLVSQTAIEMSAQLGTGNLDEENKGIMLQESDEKSRLNAIIPVFNEDVAKVLKPLLRTKLFGMLNTFCILKNPHIVDMNAHFAALACVFIKTITEFPKENRPSFIKERIKLIESTARIYLDRRGLKKYSEVLYSDPKEAIMTESKEDFGDITIKCETLIKASFFLYLMRNDPAMKLKLKEIIRLIVIEFIGRNLSKYNEQTPYSDFFVPEISSKEKRKIWTEKQLKGALTLLDKFIDARGPLLQTFFTVDSLLKEVKSFCSNEFDKRSDALYEIGVCSHKVNKFHNPSSAGDFYISGLKAVALETGITESDVANIFSEENIFTFLYHSLQHKNSSDRLSKNVISYNEAFKDVKIKVAQECNQQLKKLSIALILEEAENRWCEQFLEAHKELVKPMTAEEIIKGASEANVNVSLATFNDVFKYNPKTGLLRNSCMVTKCPHFLVPNRSFNQHIWIERRERSFSGHRIHKTSMEVASENGNVEMVFERMLKEEFVGTCGRKTPPRPSKEALEALTNEIDTLLKQYKCLLHNEEPDMMSQEA